MSVPPVAPTSDPLPSLQAAAEAQGDKVRKLKAEKADASVISKEVELLKSLKAQVAQAAGGGAVQGDGVVKKEGGKSKGKEKFTLKTPKGTRDWSPLEMALREHIFSTITTVFKKHGAVTIDTPVFELKEILAGKYGEDSKLIYDLQDQGGELCSLRYDLTVPFARFLAMNGATIQNIKRYHIAKVYRRDQPAMTKGRMREFYQCDFDIAGTYDSMVPDAEVLCTLCEVLEALDVGEFTVKLNHRKILDGIFELCGVPSDKIRTISSAVDKLDKSPWSEVRREMTEDKGLDGAVADRIGEYVKLKGGEDLLEKLKSDDKLVGNVSAAEGIKDMETLFGYLKAFGVLKKMSFDLSLARGLDYYTGIIYEAIVEASAPPGFKPSENGGSSAAAAAPAKPVVKKKTDEEDELDESTVGVGSIAAGGRYDNLVGMFSGSKKPNAVPCVGVSVGVERVFSILMQKAKEKDGGELRRKGVDVFVMSMGEGLLLERMAVAKQLWDAGIKAEFLYKVKPKGRAQFEAIEKDRIPFAVMVAPDELKAGLVRVKAQVGKEGDAGKGEEVKRDDLVAYIKEKMEKMDLSA